MPGAIYECFDCGSEYESLDDLVPVAGAGDRSPRHFCPTCAWRVHGVSAQ